ncbi:MAG TPA: hypothetical protein VFS43_18435 [Polyangiaceae bacterium]|nr:hypothetical protein [Polyangiaceae bacterium]
MAVVNGIVCVTKPGMKRTLGGALLGAAVWLGACTPPPFVSPAQGGPKWSKLTSRHFTLYTDVPTDEAQGVARELEDIYGALEDIAFPYPQKPKWRFEVTLFQREDAYREISSSRKRGCFVREAHDPDGRPMLVLHRGLDPDLRRVLQHRFTRYFIAFYFPVAPPWLREGYAHFYETLTLKGGKVEVGRASPSWVFGLDSEVVIGTSRGAIKASRDELPGPSALVKIDWRGFYGLTNDPHDAKRNVLNAAASWNLVHTMHFGPRPLKEAFDQYLHALHEGDEPGAAWDAALRDKGVSPEQLEAEYRKSFGQARIFYNTGSYAPRLGTTKAHVQPMPEVEVRLLWARVRPWEGGHLKRVGEELDAALNADPTFASAYRLRGEWFERQRRGEQALADYRKARALAPDDFRTAYSLASYLHRQAREHPGDAQREAEMKELFEGLRESAGSVAAWNNLAWYDALRGDPERGLPFARKAIAANPSCFECYDTVAVLLYRLGRLDEAVAAQRIAVYLAPEGLKKPDMLARLQTFEKELAARTASRPAAPLP